MTTATNAMCQIVKESDGCLWKQELRWDDEFGFVGHVNPEETVNIPDGAIKIDVSELEWEPVTEGCTVLAAWMCCE